MDNDKKKDFFKSKAFILLLFLLGIMVALYPSIAQWYYKIEANEETENFEETINTIDKKELEKKVELIKAYNRTLDPMRLNNPISEMEKKGIKNYMNMLDANEKVGFIEIPKIDQKIPIYIGTSEEVLLKGAGHLEGTSLPIGGKNTHSVITAHSGLPEARLFTDLDKMEIGDKFYINILEEVIAYKVNQILVIDPYDFEHILVVKDKDYSTLLTCTPTSINSHRLLVRGERVPYVKPVKEEMDSKKVDNINEKLLMGSIVIAIFIVLVFLYVLYKKKLIKINKNNKV